MADVPRPEAQDSGAPGAHAPSPTHLAPAPGEPRPAGLREVLLVAAGVVAVVLGLAMATSLLPTDLQGVVFRTPLLIVVLVAGTLGLLGALALRGRRDGRPR